MCLHSVIMESKRMLEDPERSLWGFLIDGRLKDSPRKMHINFQISTFLGSAPSPMYLQSVIMESKRTLEVPERNLGVFLTRWMSQECIKEATYQFLSLYPSGKSSNSFQQNMTQNLTETRMDRRNSALYRVIFCE